MAGICFVADFRNISDQDLLNSFHRCFSASLARIFFHSDELLTSTTDISFVIQYEQFCKFVNSFSRLCLSELNSFLSNLEEEMMSNGLNYNSNESKLKPNIIETQNPLLYGARYLKDEGYQKRVLIWLCHSHSPCFLGEDMDHTFQQCEQLLIDVHCLRINLPIPDFNNSSSANNFTNLALSSSKFSNISITTSSLEEKQIFDHLSICLNSSDLWKLNQDLILKIEEKKVKCSLQHIVSWKNSNKQTEAESLKISNIKQLNVVQKISLKNFCESMIVGKPYFLVPTDESEDNVHNSMDNFKQIAQYLNRMDLGFLVENDFNSAKFILLANSNYSCLLMKRIISFEEYLGISNLIEYKTEDEKKEDDEELRKSLERIPSNSNTRVPWNFEEERKFYSLINTMSKRTKKRKPKTTPKQSAFRRLKGALHFQDSAKNMINEVLLCLSGFSGNIIIETKHGFTLDNDVSFLSESEKVLVNEICQIGYYFKEIDNFVKMIRELDGKTLALLTPDNFEEKSMDTPLSSSMYVRAFASGIEEIIEAYLNQLASTEREIRCNPNLSFSYLKHAFQDFNILFPVLFDITHKIKEEEICGGPLLNLIYESSTSGVPILQATFNRLLHHCHRILLRYISSWILHGILPQINEEFFICEITDQSKNDINQNSWMKQYSIRSPMLPSYFPLRLAKKIKFVGNAVRLTENIPRSYLSKFEQELKQHELASSIHFISLEFTIDSIKTRVTNYLWNLILVDADLFGHLNALRGYFLLQKGDFHQSFIDETQSLMSLPPTQHATEALQHALYQTSVKCSLEDDEYFNRISISFQHSTSSDIDENQGLLNSWRGLKLHYSVDWPLQLLFHSGVIEKYNKLFSFLFYVKRVQTTIQHIWKPLTTIKTENKNIREKMSPIFLLRSQMGFMMDTFQYYLEVDVLLTQYDKLVEKIKSAHDFDTARKAHDEFLKTLENQFFLHSKLVMKTLEEIFSLIMQFCFTINEAETNAKVNWNKIDIPKIMQISKTFAKKSNLLVSILSGLTSREFSFSSLLTNIDCELM